MTTSQRTTRKISLEMKSQGHYKKAAKSYRKSDQYINMINLYPILQSTLIDCENENLVCLLYTSPSPRDLSTSRMPSSA